MDKLNLIDFERYTITKDGKIFSKYYNRFIICKPNARGGYAKLTLKCKDGVLRQYYWHRVIWFYFNGDIPNSMQINHKDECKTNNALDNLELLSPKDNCNYGNRNNKISSNNFNQSKPILQYNLETKEPIKEWKSACQIKSKLGYSQGNIRIACNGGFFNKRQNKWINLHQAYGYGWRYI